MDSKQLLTNRLRELHFPQEFFPPADLAKLLDIVEAERTQLEGEYHTKLRDRVAKLITRKSIAGVIRDTPEAVTATSATSTGDAQ
jgi:cell division septum initiation protein DivIVA